MDNYENSLRKKMKRDTLIGIGVIVIIVLIFLVTTFVF